MSTPTPVPDDILQGVCEDSNPYFWAYFGGSVALSLLIMYCRYRLVTPPTYTGAGNVADFGRPYGIGILLYHICMWNLAPQVAFFVIFHVMNKDMFPLQTNCVCLSLGSIPFIPIFLFAQATLIMVAYMPNSIRQDVGDVVVPAHPDTASGDKPVKTLFLGCTGRAALLIDALDKEQRGVTHTEAHMVDYAHTTAGAFARYNGKCFGVFDKVVSRFHRSTWSDGNKFILPFPDGSFDRVVVSPFIRNAAPVGEFMTGDDTKIPRMVRMLREGMRVLRTDGELFAYDQAANIVPLWADLRDAGYKATIVDPFETAGPIFFMKAKMLKLHCPHQTPSDAASNAINVGGSAQAPLVHHEVVGDDVAVHRESSNGNTLYIVLLAVQSTIFVALMFIAVALYEPLSVPTSIPLSTRFNNVVANVPTSYPMMAYFSRDALLNSDTPPTTVAALLRACLVSEGFALLATLFFSILLGLPGFLMQLALASTSLSTDNRSIIGLAISVALGILMFKRGRASARTGMISKRQIPEEYATHLAA